MRKMLVAMAKDLRVLIIKLSDRLHNLRTIAAMPAWKQERTARETIDIYAPLAHRLGMQEVRQELEDLSFAALHPKRYAEIDHMVSIRSPERDLYLAQVLEQVRDRLAELRINAEVTGRPKHLYSIYEKMVVKGREFDDIFDLVGIRVIVDSVKDCYAALGSIHATWKPVQGRFKDYVAMPKFNLYQSLHTTVVGPQGKPLEVQIRTYEMHARAEQGVAAHWQYKDGYGRRHADMAWLNRIIDWQSETSDPDEFMDNLKIDLEQDEVFVFTPKGKVVTLAAGATPDRLRLRHPHRGRARLHRRPGQRPPRAARLEAVVGRRRRGLHVEGGGRRPVARLAPHRRHAARRSPRSASGSRGSAARTPWRPAARSSSRRMRREGLPVQKLANGPVLPEIAEELNYVDLDALYAAIGENHVSGKAIAARVAKQGARRSTPTTRRTRPSRPPCASPRRPGSSKRPAAGVHVEGLDDLMVRLSRCCTPVPGDEILGFVTRGRGVSVHRADCANAVSLADGQGDRLIDVDWDESHQGTFVASIEVKALDRGRLLRDVAAVHERPPRQHPQLHHPHRLRPRVEDALRVRAGRPRPPRQPPRHPPRHRQRLRGLPSRPRPRRLTPSSTRAFVRSETYRSWARGLRDAGAAAVTASGRDLGRHGRGAGSGGGSSGASAALPRRVGAVDRRRARPVDAGPGDRGRGRCRRRALEEGLLLGVVVAARGAVIVPMPALGQPATDRCDPSVAPWDRGDPRHAARACSPVARLRRSGRRARIGRSIGRPPC